MQPLKDIRVVAVTGFLAGPYASMNFARLGAEVIKVELPGKGDPVRGNGPFIGPEGKHPQQRTPDDISTRFLKRNQGVKSVTLNLKHPQGRKMFLDLAKSSDVMLENLAPGSLTRMGLGYKDVSAVNPSIIYCSISGYGQTGEYADRPAHDPQIQGMSGLMEINGHPDGPPTRVGFYIGDLVTPLFACYAITAALREKERTGKGQYLDVSMMDTLTSIMMMDTLEDDVEMGLPLRMGNTTRGGPTGLYRTSDGELTITAASDDQWRRLANALDSPELAEDPRFAEFHSRTANVVEARVEIQKRVEKITRAEALERFEAADVPCGAVRTVDEAINDKHFWDRRSLLPMRHGKMDDPVPGIVAGFPVIFSGGELPEPYGAPTLGMHNKEIYGGVLNLSEDEITGLKEEGVI